VWMGAENLAGEISQQRVAVSNTLGRPTTTWHML